VISLRLEVPRQDHDYVIGELWEAGTQGVTEEGEELRAFFADDSAGGTLLERFRDFAPVLQIEEEHDWVADVEAQWVSFAVGERFWLAPEWRNDPAPAGRLRLRIHPGMACGTGTAPATQLCLMAMERWVRPGQSLLDVGTGTGILADAGGLLGAAPVAACDIDVEAAAIARRNLGNGIAVFAGSLRSLRTASVDTIVANLNAETLAANAAEFGRVRREGALIIVAGFRDDEGARVCRALKSEPRDRLEMDDWLCLVL